MKIINEKFNAKVTQTANSEELIDLAKEKGIILPSDNLGAFKTVYARLEDANKNGVRLATDAVEKALQSLIGAQVNINHWRENWTIGSIFWAKINDNDEIEVAFTFFKDVYPEEYELAMELFGKGELTVSFELTADKDKQEFHADGTRTLHDVHFVGCGLLLNENPAEPTAIVFESAKRQIEELVTQSTGNLVFAKDNEINFDRLREAIKATLNPDTIKVLDTESQINPVIQGGSKLMDKAKKEETLVKAEEVIEPKTEETSEVKSTEVSEEKVDKESKAKSEEEVVETKSEEVAEEEKVEEPKVEEPKPKEEKSEEVKEDKPEVEEKAEDSSEEAESDKAKVEYKTEIKKEITETYDEDEVKVEVESEVVETVEVDGEPSSKVVEKTKSEIVYTYAEVEAIKAELNAEIALLQEALEAKDSEIESAKKVAVKVTELKAELGEYVADFTEEDFLNEDKVEIARLRKDNDSLKSEKAPVVEEAKTEESKEVIEASTEEKVDLDTGHKEVETASNSKSALRDVLKEGMKNQKEV